MTDKTEWNQKIRASIDALLTEAGYSEDSSVRHQLAMMNFDPIEKPKIRVVNIRDFYPRIEAVPVDHIRCSVSGEYRPPGEFMDDAGIQTRTNCTATYLMSVKDSLALKAKTIGIQRTQEYRNLVSALETEAEYFGNSVPVDEMIRDLTELQVKDPGARIMISQSGYYCNGHCAEIHSPELEYEANGTNFFSIGESSQNP